MPVKAGVVRAGERQTRRGAAETFTGVVFQDPVDRRQGAVAHGRLGRDVTPGARTAWHAHPVGQTLYCLSGVGRICFEGEQPQVLNPGDAVNIPPEHDALARRLARPAVLASGVVGSRREGRGHRLGQARQRRGVHPARHGGLIYRCELAVMLPSRGSGFVPCSDAAVSTSWSDAAEMCKLLPSQG